MNTWAQKLKPCPFCGGKPWRSGHAVQCGDCGAGIVSPDGQPGADKMWNQRISPEPETKTPSKPTNHD